MKKKQLTKLTDYSTGSPVYIDITDISAIKMETGYHDNGGYNSISGTAVHVHNPEQATTVYTQYGRFQLREHISEIIAMVEGRDPLPAKILFKGSNDRG